MNCQLFLGDYNVHDPKEKTHFMNDDVGKNFVSSLLPTLSKVLGIPHLTNCQVRPSVIGKMKNVAEDREVMEVTDHVDPRSLENYHLTPSFERRLDMATAINLKHIPVRRVYPSRNKFPCQFCPKVFYDENHFKSHLEMHGEESIHENSVLRKPVPDQASSHEVQEYCCPFCQKQFKSRKFLARHFKATHGEEESDQENSGLPEESTVPNSPEAEENTILPKESFVPDQTSSSEEYCCPICQKVFNSQEFLDGHVRANHEEGPIQEKTVLTEKSTVPEQKSSIEAFICTFCQKVFKSQESLDRHVVATHSESFCMSRKR